MFDDALIDDASRLLVDLRAADLAIATAESCTGGLIIGALTEIAGSSDVVDRGFVTYSNEAKMTMLGVPAALLQAHGAVSAEVAQAMAHGALVHSEADVTVAVTGVAGPGGGSASKPVGLVHIAVAAIGRDTIHRECRFGDIGRPGVRRETILAAFALVREMVAKQG
jgi:nicotinamide-nucleotide amidase